MYIYIYIYTPAAKLDIIIFGVCIAYIFTRYSLPRVIKLLGKLAIQLRYVKFMRL